MQYSKKITLVFVSLLCLLLLPLVSAETFYHNKTQATSDSVSNGYGIGFKTNVSGQYYINVTRVSGVTADVVYLLNGTTVLSNTTTFTGDVAQFSNTSIVAGTNYSVIFCKIGGGSYTRKYGSFNTYPLNAQNGTFAFNYTQNAGYSVGCSGAMGFALGEIMNVQSISLGLYIASGNFNISAKDFYTNTSLSNFSALISQGNNTLGYQPFSNNVAWYKLDDNTQTAVDSSGNANTATLNGWTFNDGQLKNAVTPTTPPLLTEGKYGLAYNFTTNGSQIDTNKVINYNDISFTICAWTHATEFVGNSQNNYIVSSYPGSSPQVTLRFDKQFNQTLFTTRNSTTTVNSLYTYNIYDHWNYICGVVNRTSGLQYLYINGTLVDSDSFVTGNISPSSSLNIGWGTSGTTTRQQFNGTIDEVRFWNTSLSSSQILQEMNSPYPVNGNNLVASYSFESNFTNATGNYTYDTNNLVAGQINGSFTFDGVNDRVSTSDIDLQTGTLSVWINTNSLSGDKYIMCKNDVSSYAGAAYCLYTSGSRVRLLLQTGAVAAQENIVQSTTTLTANSWVHILATFTTNNITLYVNGTNAGCNYVSGAYSCSNFSGTINNNSNLVYIGASSGSGFNWFNGSIDNPQIWARWTNSSETYNVYQAGAYRIYNYSTTTGSIDTRLPLESGNYNVTLNSKENGGYFNRFYSDYNLSTNLEATMAQSIIDFYGYEKISGLTLSGVNFTTSFLTNTTHYMRAGTYNVTATKSGYYNLSSNYTAVAFSSASAGIGGMYSTLFNITAKNNLTNSSISGFSYSIYNAAYSYTENGTATSTEALVGLIPGSYNFTISASGFATATYTVVISATGLANQTFGLYQGQSIFINIYNSSSIRLINSTVTIQFLGTQTYLNSTTNGTLFMTNLSAGNYNATFSATGFQPSTYIVTVGDNSFQTLNVYLDSLTSNSVVFSVYDDETTAVLPGTLFNVEKEINGTYYLVNNYFSDITGRIEMIYESGVTYRFTLSKIDYNTKVFVLDPILFSSYDVRLQRGASTSLDISLAGMSIDLGPSSYYNNVTNNLSILLGAPAGDVSLFNVTVVVSNNITTFTNSSTNAYGTRLTLAIPITNASSTDKVYVYYTVTSTSGSSSSFLKIYSIEGQARSGSFAGISNNQFGLALLDRIIITVILTSIISGLGMALGGIPTGSFLALGTLGYLGAIGFVAWWVAIPTMVGIALFAMWSLQQ